MSTSIHNAYRLTSSDYALFDRQVKELRKELKEVAIGLVAKDLAQRACGYFDSHCLGQFVPKDAADTPMQLA